MLIISVGASVTKLLYQTLSRYYRYRDIKFTIDRDDDNCIIISSSVIPSLAFCIMMTLSSSSLFVHA